MKSENETVADVLMEMRNRNKVRKVRLRQYGGVQCNCSIAPDDVPAVYADRLETAHRRELAVKDNELRIVADHYGQVLACKDRLIALRNVEIARLRALVKEMADALNSANEEFEIRKNNEFDDDEVVAYCDENIDRINALIAKAQEVCND